MTPINKCHRCGATNYKSVITRDESGTMTPSGQFQCVGCKFQFTDIDVWKHGPGQESNTQTDTNPQ